MTSPACPDLTCSDRCWPLVIIGGGPAAARQIVHSRVPAKDILVVSDRLGGWMRALGRSPLQSYTEELVVGDDPTHLRTVLGIDDLQPTGDQYSGYVSDQIRVSGAQVLLGEVQEVGRWETRGPGREAELKVEVVTPDGTTACLRARRVVLATGVRPRRPSPAWTRAGAVTFDVVYADVHAGRAARYRNQSVIVVGAGNSALQTAALVSRFARDVTIVANRYHGMYPQETNDRFAWRSWSQITCEMITKGAERCAEETGVVPCVRFLVYDDIHLRDDGHIILRYRASANQNVLGRASLPPRCGHVRAEMAGSAHDGPIWSEDRAPDTTVVWATGVEPCYPPGDMIGSLPRDAEGYLLGPAEGRTVLPNLFVTGACARARAVNEMWSVPVDDDSDRHTGVTA